MPEKPLYAAEYRKEMAELVRQTCLYVATKLGDLLDELVVVGGLVPFLLIPEESGFLCTWTGIHGQGFNEG